MIGWGSILYGAALSAGLGAVAIVVGVRERRLGILTPAIASTLVAPIAWNAILRATHAREFFTDAPTKLFPVSWQDTGSGVFTLALGSLVLGALRPRERAGKVLAVSAVAALVAFLVDIYLY